MSNGALATQLITSILGGGLGAGVVTFLLNFWKGERDIRRANLERLYTAVHKFTKGMVSRRLPVLQGFTMPEDPSRAAELNEQFDLICVLVDLYFPRLKPDFEGFRKKALKWSTQNEKFVGNQDAEKLKEAISDLLEEGKNFKRAVARLVHEMEASPAG
jgi:hypothetical protein